MNKQYKISSVKIKMGAVFHWVAKRVFESTTYLTTRWRLHSKSKWMTTSIFEKFWKLVSKNMVYNVQLNWIGLTRPRFIGHLRWRRNKLDADVQTKWTLSFKWIGWLVLNEMNTGVHFEWTLAWAWSGNCRPYGVVLCFYSNRRPGSIRWP